MAVSFRAAGTSASLSSGSTLTLGLPTGTQSGDYLIAFVHDQTTAATVDFTPPAGWSKIGPAFTASSAPQRVTSMFAKFATGSEPATFDFTTPGVGGRVVGIIHGYSGVDSTSPVAASSGFSQNGSTSTSLSVAAFAGSSSLYTIEFSSSQYASPASYALSGYTGGLTLQSEVFRSASATQTPPSPEDTAASRTAMRVWQGMADAGGVPAHTITTGSANQFCAALIALSPAVGAPAATPTISGYMPYALLANITATAGDTAHAVTVNPQAAGVVGASLAVGDWMVVTVYCGSQASAAKTPTAPGDWTVITPFAQVGSGTMSMGVWARKRQASETTYTWTVNNDTGRVAGMIYNCFWVHGAQDVAQWTIGTFANRETNATSTTTLAPSITTTQANSLAITIAGERTTTAETDGQVTVANFTKLFFNNAASDTTSMLIAQKDMPTIGATGNVTVTYPNAHNYNGRAGIISVPGVAAAATGLQIKRSDGATLQTAYLKVSNGGGTLVTPGGLRVLKPGYSSVTAMLASNPFYVAHRGGSRDFPEMSLYAYGQSALRGYGALELSLARTSDGVWFGLHDADINRTSGTTGLGAASTMTWAQVQNYQILGSMAPNNTSQANRPYMRFEELMALYYPSHVIFMDIKYAAAYQAEFISKINALPGTPQDHIVGKAFGVGASFPNAMHAAGYKTWGYFYQSDVPTNIANYQSYWDILGMDYGADSTAWSAVTSYGKPVIGHICPNVAAKNTAIGYGAVGIMSSGAINIVPNTPYSNN